MVSHRVELRSNGTLITTLLSCLGLLLMLWSPQLTAAAIAHSSDYDVQLRPAWEGYIRAGSDSELELRLLAPHEGRGTITVSASLATVVTDFHFQPQVPLLLRIPLRHSESGPVPVIIEVAGKEVFRQQLQLQLLSPAESLVAQLGSSSQWTATSAGARILYLTAADLPSFSASYNVVTSLRMAAFDAQALRPEQRLALAGFLANCGRVALSGIGAVETALLRSQAGCGGRRLRQPGSTVSNDWADRETASLPGGSTLARLPAPTVSGAVRSLAVFCCAYVLVLVLVARAGGSARALLATPLLAAALAVLGWTLGGAAQRTSSWSEMDSGDAVLRYVGLLQLEGNSRAPQKLLFDADWGIPRVDNVELPGPLRFDAEKYRHELVLDSRLLDRHAFVLHGSALAPAVELRADAQGVIVVNHGGSTMPAATVAWQGNSYAVPALMPGASWRQSQTNDPWRQSLPQQLLRQRAVDGGTWMLLPYQPDALQLRPGVSVGSGWLLIRGHEDV